MRQVEKNMVINRRTVPHQSLQPDTSRHRLSSSALILTGSVNTGDHIADLLQKVGCNSQLIHNDQHAYDLLRRLDIDTIIVDIETQGLNGLSCLSWCKVHRPSITAYVICSGGNSRSMRIARDLGCRGYFYLRQGNALVETRYGMAREITLM